jgi:hypothetical protein
MIKIILLLMVIISAMVVVNPYSRVDALITDNETKRYEFIITTENESFGVDPFNISESDMKKYNIPDREYIKEKIFIQIESDLKNLNKRIEVLESKVK